MKKEDKIKLFNLIKNRYLANMLDYDTGVVICNSGLCYAAGSLLIDNTIIREEYDWFMQYLASSFNITTFAMSAGFLWPIEDKEARINWLDEQIKKHS